MRARQGEFDKIFCLYLIPKLIMRFKIEIGKMNRLIIGLKDSKYVFFSLILFILVLVYATALGQILRWDLAQPIAMADAFLETESFYPSENKVNISSVSIYFPGISFLAVGLIKMGFGDLIFELMLFLAGSLFLGLIYLISLASRSFSKNDQCQSTVFGLFLIFTLIFCDLFYIYAVEFKPDSIMLCVGLTSLLLAKQVDTSSHFTLFLLGVAFSLGLLFKQQYIASIVALVFYSFLINRSWKYFGFGCLFASCAIIYSLLKIEGLQYWTISVVSNHGFWAIKQYASTNLDFYFAIIGVLTLFYFYNFNPLASNDGKNILPSAVSKIKLVAHTPIAWFLLASAAAAYAGSWKIGGNSGNGEIAILLTSTLFLTSVRLRRRLAPNALLLIAVAVLLPKGVFGGAQYLKALEARHELNQIMQKYENPEITFDSGHYYLIRGQTSHTNYWDTRSIRTKKLMPKSEALEILVTNYEPKLILAIPNLSETLKSFELYTVVSRSEVYMLAEKDKQMLN